METPASLVIVVVAALAALLLASAWSRRRRLPGFVLLGVLLLGAGLGLGRNRGEDPAWSARLPGPGPEADHATSDTCRACHPSEYASWHATFHRTMTRQAGPGTVLARFDGVVLQHGATRFRLERDGDAYRVHVAPAVSGAPEVERVYRVGLLTGSHHLQLFWLADGQGNRQQPFPFAWLIDEARWVPNEDTFLRDPELPPPSTPWNERCIDCHSVAGRQRPGPGAAFDSTVAELGIACEACHGPAAEHVRVNHDPLRRHRMRDDTARDATIVDPRDLDPGAASQICGHCHSLKYIPDAADWAANGSRYRPGDALETLTPIVQPSTFLDGSEPRNHPRPTARYLSDRFWPDGTVRVTGREYNGLIDSPCFQRGPLSCLSCHSMHDSDPDDQLAAGADGDEACLQCHDGFRQRVAEHTHHAPESSGSRCYNCHMPHTTYGLLQAIRSHRIDSPSAVNTLDSGRPNACNLCHLDRTLAWSAEHLGAWYGQPQVALPPEHHEVAASLLDLLRGDAAQRALIAWHLAWPPARQASGDDWIPPWLALGLNDPYSAVRFMAYRSLRRYDEFERLEFDYVGPAEQRRAAAAAALRRALARGRDDAGDPQRARRLLLDDGGSIRMDAVRHWLARRDHRSLEIQE